jgi:biopolymer transport protein ExbD
MRIKKTKALEANIPTASMADIAFLLIVFFMISTVFSVDKTSVNLPQSSNLIRTEVVKGSAFIVLLKDGQIKASDGSEDSRLVNMEDVGILASNWMSKNPNQPVVIKADMEVRYNRIDEVLDKLRNAGVINYKFLTEAAKD